MARLADRRHSDRALFASATVVIVLVVCALAETLASLASPFVLRDGQPFFIFDTAPIHGPIEPRVVRGTPLWFREHPGRALPSAVKNGFRIVMLGDSILEPAALEQSDGIAAKLSDWIRVVGGPTDVEVVNTAEGGWGTVQEEAFLFDAGLALKPDLILVGITENDTQEFVHHRGQIMRVHLVDALDARPTDGLAGLLLRYSYMYNLAWLSAQRIQIDRGTEDGPARERRLVLEPLQRMHAAAEHNGIRFGLICFGGKPESTVSRRRLLCPLPLVVRWAEESGVPLLAANALFSQYAPEVIWMDHIHLMPLGHDLLSEATASWLVQEGLLAATGQRN